MDKYISFNSSTALIHKYKFWFAAAVSVMSAAVIIFFSFAVMLNYTAGMNYFEIADEHVPSLKYAVGMRELSRYDSKFEGEKFEYKVTYRRGRVSTKDMEAYVAVLEENGYALVHQSMDSEWDGNITMGKDVNDGKHVMLIMMSNYNNIVSVQYRNIPGSLGS